MSRAIRKEERPTLGQAAQILNIFKDQQISVGGLEVLLRKGLLPDLLKVEANLIDRSEFRRVIGLAVTVTVDPDVPLESKPPGGARLIYDKREPSGKIALQLVELFESSDIVARPCHKYLSTLLERKDCLGQRHAEALLLNKNLIPQNFRPFRLFFPATAWNNGWEFIPYLEWRGRWLLDFLRITSFINESNPHFYDTDRLVTVLR